MDTRGSELYTTRMSQRQIRKVLGVAAGLLLFAAPALGPVLPLLGSALWPDSAGITVFRQVFSDPGRYLVFCRNTVGLCGVTLAFCFGLGLPLGFLLTRTDLPGRRVLLLGFIPLAGLPLYITVAAWTGLLGHALWYGLPTWWQKCLIGGLVQTAAWLPLTVLLCSLALRRIHPALEDEARLHAGPARVLCSSSLPQALPALVVTGFLLVLLSLNDLAVTDTLNLATLPQESYLQFQLPDLARETGPEFLRPRRAAAVMLPPALLLAGFGVWLLRRLKEHGQGSHADLEKLHCYRLGRWRWPALALVGGIPALLLGGPLLHLLRLLGPLGGLWETVQTAGLEIRNTIGFGVVAATLSTALGLAWAQMARRQFWLFGAVFLLAALPAPLLGIALIQTWNTGWGGWLYDSPGIYVYAWVLRALPAAMLLLSLELRQVPAELEEDCRLSGGGELRLWLHVRLPFCRRGLACAWLLSFLLCQGELGATFLVQVPGWTTLGVRFFTLVHAGVDAVVAGICLITLALALLPGIVLAWLLAPRRSP